MRKKWLWVVAILLSLLCWLLYQHSYAFDEQQQVVRFADGRTLDITVTLPQGSARKLGVVLFIHGDGPANASYDDYYQPLWEALAQAGYASVSWSKPGIGGSSGNWLQQSMEDRAKEAQLVLDWVRKQPQFDTRRIGLWGSSQAGWVLPKVAARDCCIRFVIAVSPAINWLQQGRYHSEATLQHQHADAATRQQSLQRRQQVLALLQQGGSYGQYLQVAGSEPMSADRWQFVQRNWQADATLDLQALAKRPVPVLLLLGALDRNVDILNTEQGYRQWLPASRLTVIRYPDTYHAMTRRQVEDSATVGWLTSLFRPRAVYNPDYLQDLQRYAGQF
ncbi:alpha/beta hydrolase family protein [Leeia sp.]|uniref:alpha/beta hydrolase family protein n=1 Tax=Leeia sp. TaxID=2884678 RepID=UPI0035B38836